MDDVNILESLNIPVQLRKSKQARIVKWTRPSMDGYKLNVDGSSVESPGVCGAGGIVRNSNGDLLMAFSVSVGNGTNNFAEISSLLFGIPHCAEASISTIEIEMDSLIVVKWLKKKVCGLRYLYDFLEEIQSYLAGMQVTIRHISRECNVAADFLARMGARGTYNVWHQYKELPLKLKGILKIDKVGLPSIRFTAFL